MFLVPFLVIVETISSLIRPLTLSLRLAANVTSGHLLLVLAGIRAYFNLTLTVVAVCITLIVILELAVSAIQAFVFYLLCSIYTEENIF